MAPPEWYASRPLMLAASAPLESPGGLMSVDAAAFEGYDLRLELTRLLWIAAAVVAVLICLGHAAAR